VSGGVSPAKVALLLALVLAGSAAAGESGGSVSTGGAEASGGKLATTTTLTVTGLGYLHPGEPRSRVDARLLVEAVWAVAPWGEISGTVALNGDSDQEIERNAAPDWLERSLRRRAVEVRELELTAHLPAADLTFGNQALPWGIGDGLQPTDSLTPRDLTDPLLDERMGSWGASADLFLGGTEAILTAVRHAPHRLPLLDRRWSPVGDLGSLRVVRELPAGSDAWIGAFQLRGYARALDWSVVARRGPDLAPHLAGVSPTAVTLDYPRMSLLGGWVSVPWGSVVLRGEIAWRRYERRAGRVPPEDFATALVGVEDRFAGLVLGKDATWITELVHEAHTGGTELPREIAILDPVRLLHTGVLTKLLVHNPTGWEAEAGGALDLAEGGGLVQLLARYNASDHLELEIGLDLLVAAGNPALAPIADNDRLVLRTTFRP
jgi:hypothetical protein